MATQSKLLLYDHPASGFAQKVRMALRLKDIPFDQVIPEKLGSGQANDAFTAANPRLEVPALVDGDLKLFDSKVILEYLEDKYPSHPLLPKDPTERARARLIQEVCDSQYEAINWAMGEINGMDRATGDLRDRMNSQAKVETDKIYDWLLQYLGTNKFFNGDIIGFADVCVAPHMHWSVVHGLGPEPGSPLASWKDRVGQIPAIQETWAEMEEAMKQMAAYKDFFKPGSGARREYRDHRLEWMIRNGGIGIVGKGIEEKTVRFSWPGMI